MDGINPYGVRQGMAQERPPIREGGRTRLEAASPKKRTPRNRTTRSREGQERERSPWIL